MIRRCDIARSKLIRDEHIGVGEYIEVNKKTLKVFGVFSKGANYFYLAKLYENSNHHFLVSESRWGKHKNYEVLTSFTGRGEGLEQTIKMMYKFLGENNRSLKRIK